MAAAGQPVRNCFEESVTSCGAWVGQLAGKMNDNVVHFQHPSILEGRYVLITSIVHLQQFWRGFIGGTLVEAVVIFRSSLLVRLSAVCVAAGRSSNPSQLPRPARFSRTEVSQICPHLMHYFAIRHLLNASRCLASRKRADAGEVS